MRAAFRIAQSGRKGPVLVDIPKDVTAAVCEFTPKQPEPIRTVTTYNEEQVHWAADLINAAQRPLVYFGGGVRSAASCQPLRDLLHKAEIPATYTLMAAGVVPYGDPMNLGMLGMHGCYTSNRAVAECDVLIAVGTRFSDRVALNPKTFAKNATIIQIDIDASELGKNVDVDLSIVGDAAYVLNAMLPQIKPAKHPEWMKMIQSWQAQDYHPVSDPTRLMPHQSSARCATSAAPMPCMLPTWVSTRCGRRSTCATPRAAALSPAAAWAPWALAMALPLVPDGTGTPAACGDVYR